MSLRHAGAALVVSALLGAPAASALAATPAQNKAFGKELASKIRPVFKKKAPTLVLGPVHCVLPENGTVVKCKAHFTDPSARADVVYSIKATLQESGTMKWTTTGNPSCTDAKTGHKLTC